MKNKTENEPINIEGEYWDCKQVVKDPQDYPDQTVIDAANFCRGYEYAIATRPQAEITDMEQLFTELTDCYAITWTTELDGSMTEREVEMAISRTAFYEWCDKLQHQEPETTKGEKK